MSNKKKGLKYSPNTSEALSKFFTFYNDIDIYVEDKCIELYKELFRRLISKKIKIRKIFDIGSRSLVIKECRNSDSTRNRLYIIDADIDLILDRNLNIPKLFVLDVYCIENYLIEEDALVEVLHSFSGELTRDDIRDKIKFKSWIDKFKKDLMMLFFLFSLCCEHSTGLRFAHIGEMCEENELSLSKIKAVTKHLISEIEKCVKDLDVKKELKKLEKRWPYTQDNFLRIISGKDYLFPLIIQKMRKIARGNYRISSLKMFMVKEIKLDRLVKLKETIENSVSVS